MDIAQNGIGPHDGGLSEARLIGLRPAGMGLTVPEFFHPDTTPMRFLRKRMVEAWPFLLQCRAGP